MSHPKSNSLAVLLSFAGQCRLSMVLSVILAVLGVAAGLIPYFAVAAMLGGLLTGTMPWPVMSNLILAAFGGYAFKILFHTLSTSLAHRAAFVILKNIRLTVIDKLSRAPMGYILETPSGKFKTGMVDTLEKLELPLAHLIPELTANLLVPAGIVGYLLYLDWRMALAALATLPIGILCYLRMLKDYGPKYEKVNQAAKNMDAAVVEYINGIEVIKAFNQSTASYGKYRLAVEANRDRVLEWFDDMAIYFALGMNIMPATLITVLPLGAYFFMTGSLSGPTYIICVILSMGIIGPLIQALEYTDSLAMVDSAIKAVNGLLNAPELKRPLERKELANHELAFNRVSFAYDKEEVLREVSFQAATRGITAIVGPSGSGKSTLAKLAASFWDTTEGTVTLGGVDLKNIPLSQIMELVAYVSQDNFLFNVSIMENIRLGRPGATDDEVFAAARAAQCHDFISRLEQGYQSPAGDAGKGLSGGERQRIAIARAMLKNSPIIVLDEATAFTDPENEHKIQESINNLVRHKTLIIIAHRLSTIIQADRIVVMNQGKLEAIGRHAELLAGCDLYKGMWEAHISSKEAAQAGPPEEAHV